MTRSRGPKRAEAGAVIGGYELVRRVGKGGMAEVWVARKALGQKGAKSVAIKLIVDHNVGDERYARMFRAEAELAASLSHANIVQLFDEGEDEGRRYLIMEWVDGLNLLKLGDKLALLDDEQQRFRIIAYIIGQLLHALHYAHSITSADGHPLGVVHRDVSPQNVLVSNHGEVKLTDFGVAYYNVEESSGIHVKGKVRYMSPEQLGGRTRSPTVDLYAVGALLHELLDGKKFRGGYEDGQELFSVVLSGVVPPLSRAAPPELDRLRLGLLEPDVNRRIQTAEHAIALLKRFPEYGDARDELTKLCGGLTGVVKPRVGPGQSSQHAAAELQATTRWGGRQELAKPKVDMARPLLAPSPPPPKPARPFNAPVAAVAPKMAVAGLREEAAKESALITGETELMQRELLPTTPVRVSNLRALASERRNAEMSNVAPGAESLGELARPGGHAQWRSEPYGGPGPGAGYMAAQAMNPYGMPGQAPANGGPVYGSGQAPHLMQVPPAQGWIDPSTGIAPTQRLSAGGATGLAAQGYVTRAMDPNTDQDIVASGAAGDGTDTRRDVRGDMATRTSSVSVVPQQSVMAVLGVGLVLVAMMSVGITWIVFSRGAGEPVENTASLEPSTAKSKGVESEPGVVEEKREVVEGLNGETKKAVESPTSDERAEAGREAGDAEGEAAGVPALVPGDAAPEAVMGEEEEEEPVDRAVEAEPSVEPSSIPVPEKKVKPLPKAYVKIVSSSGLEKSEVRLGSQTFKVNAASEHKITSGTRKIKWRRTPIEPWQSADSWNFRPGKHFVIHVSKQGPRVRTSN